jgi:hypothetical protein
MTAYQCPFCVLRFSFRNEVRWHVDNEHRSVKVTEREPEPDEVPSADSSAAPDPAPATP